MALKTVIHTNMPQACGISIVIDQDRYQKQGDDQQKLSILQQQQVPKGQSIDIIHQNSAAISTKPTAATKTPIVSTSENRPTLLKAIATEGDIPMEQWQMQGQMAGIDYTTAKLFMDVSRSCNNDKKHYDETVHDDVENDVRTDNDDARRNGATRSCGGFHIASKETDSTTTARFPHLLLKITAANPAAPSEKPTSYGELSQNQTNTKEENGSKCNDKIEQPPIQRSNREGIQNVDSDASKNSDTATNTTNDQSNRRTMIIECNRVGDNADGNERTKVYSKQHNNNIDADIHDVAANDADDDETRMTGVARVGQSAFVGICTNGICDGDGDGTTIGGVGPSTVAEDQQRLESKDAVIDAVSLTTKTDSAGALTESVVLESRKDTDPNVENLTSRTPTHVVKIQIKPINTNRKVSESDKQTVTVVTVNKDTQPYQSETEDKIGPSEACLSTSESVSCKSSNPKINKNKINWDSNLDSRMVQRSIMSIATTVTATTTAAVMSTTTANCMSGTVTGSGSSDSAVAGIKSSGGTTVTELNVTQPSYLYYVMSSGQFSPCDTLDSGTGSDLESNGNHTSTTPPKMHNASNMLPISNSTVIVGNVGVGSPKIEMHLKTTKIRLNTGKKPTEPQHYQQPQITSNNEHARAGSLTDSEESETSSLSCDSLHSTEFIRQSSVSPPSQKTANTAHAKLLGAFLPDSLLRDIRDRKLAANDFERKYGNSVSAADADADDEGTGSPPPIATEDAINEADYANVEHLKFLQKRNLTNAVVNKRASLPNKTFMLNTEDGTFVDTKMNSMPRKYEADKYYEFHVKEHENFRSFGKGNCLLSELQSLDEYESAKALQDDAFAGYKDIRCGSTTSTIRSSKGTVRGVKNRVRNGIATFLQLQQPNIKNFKEKDAGKVVLYTTSMGIIRDTYAKCANVKQILRTLLVKFEERDVFMSIEYQQEIKERMHSEIIKVPQLFVEGQHIGDADTVERLNESGELRQLLKPYKSIATTFTCQTCGGYRLLPCPSCKGSKKSVHRNHFTAEFVALKCMNCDEVGLVKCHNC